MWGTRVQDFPPAPCACEWACIATRPEKGWSSKGPEPSGKKFWVTPQVSHRVPTPDLGNPWQPLCRGPASHGLFPDSDRAL